MAAVVVTRLDEAEHRPRHVAIGEFDAVHRGHQALLDGVDTVLTFDPHPLAVLAPDRAPRLLTRLENRAELLAKFGVGEVVVVPFTRRFAAKPAADFLDEDLVARLGAEQVSVGRNFRFGRGARGDAALLEAHPRIRARVVEIVTAGGSPVSSTRVRELVVRGAVEEASELLGRPLELPVAVSVNGTRREVWVLDPQLIRPAPGSYQCSIRGEDGGWREVEVEVVDDSPEERLVAPEVNVRFIRRRDRIEPSGRCDGRPSPESAAAPVG